MEHYFTGKAGSPFKRSGFIVMFGIFCHIIKVFYQLDPTGHNPTIQKIQGFVRKNGAFLFNLMLVVFSTESFIF